MCGGKSKSRITFGGFFTNPCYIIAFRYVKKSVKRHTRYKNIYRKHLKTIHMGNPKRQRTMESWMIANGKAGQHFYSDKMDRHLTAISTHHQRKIVTEKLIIITTRGKELKSKYITKVTLL